MVVTTMILMITGCSQPNKGNKGQTVSKMDWWNEARFGMFIHWGLYSIPAGEWDGATDHAEWIRTTAQIPLEVYDTLVNYFNPVKFNADEWVRTAREAGMKYIVITSKHHDGFCLFDSEYTDFDVMSTPFKRDILAELAEACHKQGIVLCFYHSIMDWHNPDYLPRREWETDRSSEGADMEKYITYMKNQLKELITKYGALGVLWFDGEWENTWSHERGVDLYNYVEKLQPGIIINNRVDKGRSGMQGMTTSSEFKGDFGTPEQEVPSTGFPGVSWESCITLNDHWGYNKADNNWKSPETVIRMLADVASKGGNLLLNVGPKADGTFPDRSIAILKETGEWMKDNGDAIYGTSASPFRNLRWGRCTVKQEGRRTILYLHVFDWPENGILVVPGLANKVRSAYLHKSKKKLLYRRDESDIVLQVPEKMPDPLNTVISIEISGAPIVIDIPDIAPDSGIFVGSMIWSVPNVPEGYSVYYTLDGTEPTNQSVKYEGPVSLTETVTVKAAVFHEGKRESGIAEKEFRKVNPVPGQNLKITGDGLVYKYYEKECDVLPDFGSLKPAFVGVSANVEIIDSARPEDFALLFTGYLNIPSDGLYTLSLTSDDGSCLFVNGEKVIDNDGLHSPTGKKTGLPLGKGLHDVEIQFFQKKGGASLAFQIEGPAGAIEPETVFVH